MIRCGISKDTDGHCRVSQQSKELQVIVQKYLEGAASEIKDILQDADTSSIFLSTMLTWCSCSKRETIFTEHRLRLLIGNVLIVQPRLNRELDYIITQTNPTSFVSAFVWTFFTVFLNDVVLTGFLKTPRALLPSSIFEFKNERHK